MDPDYDFSRDSQNWLEAAFQEILKGPELLLIAAGLGTFAFVLYRAYLRARWPSRSARSAVVKRDLLSLARWGAALGAFWLFFNTSLHSQDRSLHHAA